MASTTVVSQAVRARDVRASAVSQQTRAPSAVTSDAKLPLLLRALKGDRVERPPVWMMRQAGRYQKVYQELCKKHPTFRERSENADLAVEISLQPYRAFRPDGVILFSDILTPLPAMNIAFDLPPGKGPVILNPIRTAAQVREVTTGDDFTFRETNHYVGEALTRLRQEVGDEATVLGFAGCPYTLATYIIEGGSSKNFTHIKRMMLAEPATLHALLDKLATNVADYVRYQADAGARVVQIFDSWAAHLMPQDFDEFCAPYNKRIIDEVRRTHPDLPIILYISGSGGLIERMAQCGPDVLSIDHSVDLGDAIRRGGSRFAYQGNLDPAILFAEKDTIRARTHAIARQARSAGVRHVMNLGHGVLPTTPEDHVGAFFEAAKEFRY